MISIIICSRRPTIDDNLSLNISATIGCEYELIVIDNSENKYSIFEAYNIGIQKSKFNILCFLHDDILIRSENWGFILIDYFNNDQKIGLIGVAGSKTKTIMPSLWWHCNKADKVTKLYQKVNQSIELWDSGFENKKYEEVKVLDGVFIAARNINFLFDETIKSFHSYDFNVSIEYLTQGYKNIVVPNILIEHNSLGNIGKDWFESSYIFHEKYNKALIVLNKKEYDKKQEITNGKWFVANALEHNLIKIAIKIWFKTIKLDPKSLFDFKIQKKIMIRSIKHFN